MSSGIATQWLATQSRVLAHHASRLALCIQHSALHTSTAPHRADDDSGRDSFGARGNTASSSSDDSGRPENPHQARLKRLAQKQGAGAAGRPSQPLVSARALRESMDESSRREQEARGGRVSRFESDMGARAGRYRPAAPAAWMQKYMDEETGTYDQDYRELGNVGKRVQAQRAPLPTGGSTLAQRLGSLTLAQLNAREQYGPNDQYEPAELNPYERDRAHQRERKAASDALHTPGLSDAQKASLEFSNAQVRAEVDYRYVSMLLAFTGRHGMLLGRHNKRIKAVTQRKVARAVKNARQMALLPHVGLHPAFEDEATRKMRQTFERLDASARAQGA